MKILVLDDEKNSCELLVDEIRKVEPDADIISFTLPLEALDYIKQNNCDVVFLDIEMPQLNGIELAKKMKQYRNDLNFIFVTGYSQYCIDAMKERASGYLLKPVTKQAVMEELQQLRFPIKNPKQGIRVVTFGFFELIVNDTIVHFNRSKSKEMLAFLVDKKGNAVCKREIASYLFSEQEYDRSIQEYMKKIVSDLKKTLNEYNVKSMVDFSYNSYAVNVDAFSCDYYDYEMGIPEALNSYNGEYMKEYSWAKYRLNKMA